MPTPSDIDDEASRANDQKTATERETAGRRARVSDGKGAVAPTDGKRHGPRGRESDRQRSD